MATVIGFSGADIDLYIYDSTGNLVVRDRGTEPWAVCTWFVQNPGVYRIVVENCFSTLSSEYQLVTN